MKTKEMESVDFIGNEMRSKISELGRLWRSSKLRPQVSIDVLDSWENLVSKWVHDESMPLIIRKSSQRGQEVTHSTGRKIIISDNSFALWVYHNVLEGTIFTLSDLKGMLLNNEIPIVYALSKENKKKAQYTKTLGQDGLSKADEKWKLCHIEPVGLNSRKKIQDFDIEEIIMHFKRYVNPKNMFILPKEIGGLGEVQEFIDEQII